MADASGGLRRMASRMGGVPPAAPGGWGRLLRYGWDQFRFAITLNFPEMPRTLPLVRFDSESDVRGWHVMSDKVFGGCSEASLALRDAREQEGENESDTHTYARFSGVLSHRIQEGSKMKRAGLCSIRSDVRFMNPH